MLPIAFQQRMEKMLGQEYAAFISSYEKKSFQSLRVNTLKAEKEKFISETDFSLEQVAWCETGYYYAEKDRPGRHPYHEAGVYYIQEASAMLPALCLAAEPGERVLDLCAAPGGKSSQIACAMQGEGLLLCNEIHPARARILSENIERMGIRNAVVTNETPQALAHRFPAYFDRILVDAPCSGEGMFRKNEEAREEWSPENVALCASRQAEILDCAARLLKPGGTLVYSTCTFSPLENEEAMGGFIKRHPEFYITKVQKWANMSDGVAEWMKEPIEEIQGTIRLWPHKLKGEGHYAAVLKKHREEGQALEDCAGKKRTVPLEKGLSEKEGKEYLDFARAFLRVPLEGKLLSFGEQLYLAPPELPGLHKLRVLRPGLHLGTLKKNRFEPAHALALALKPQEAVYHLQLPLEDERLLAYLHGETFPAEGEKGWYLICAGDYSIGWGKLSGGIMKNHYPKGLRRA